MIYENDIIPEETNAILLDDLVFLNHVTDRKTIPGALTNIYKKELLKLANLITIINSELDQKSN